VTVTSTRAGLVVGAAFVVLAGCAAPGPMPRDAATAGGEPQELGCTLPGNCVSSLGAGGVAPLAYRGTPVQAMTVLQATVASFPEARVVRQEPLGLEAIFTTPLGFRDQVDFRIDPQAQRVDFRSRSLFGLFDFGKNRSRMEEFKVRFEERLRE
jgi:uncharacterized protein (DUF1499 family)